MPVHLPASLPNRQLVVPACLLCPHYCCCCCCRCRHRPLLLLLLLQGVVSSNAFKDFIKEEVSTQEAARKLLEDKGVAHYWDLAAAFDFDAAVVPSAARPLDGN
jgi:hypothetical protein